MGPVNQEFLRMKTTMGTKCTSLTDSSTKSDQEGGVGKRGSQTNTWHGACVVDPKLLCPF